MSAFPVRLVLMLPSDLSPESYQMSAMAERMVADDSAASENDKSGLALWELFTVRIMKNTVWKKNAEYLALNLGVRLVTNRLLIIL